jgi:hypothetical protein
VLGRDPSPTSVTETIYMTDTLFRHVTTPLQTLLSIRSRGAIAFPTSSDRLSAQPPRSRPFRSMDRGYPVGYLVLAERHNGGSRPLGGVQQKTPTSSL